MVNLKNTTCCFTGHRLIPENKKRVLWELLCEQIELLYDKGYRRFCCGGALGFDTMAAAAVLATRRIHPDILFILVLPCKEQHRRWSPHQQNVYKKMLKCANEIIYTAKDYFSGCMHIRNNRLVSMSSVCIAYQLKTSGGTFYTVNHALNEGLKLINLAAFSENKVKEIIQHRKENGKLMTSS